MNDLPINIRQFLEECHKSIDERGDLPNDKRQKIYILFESPLNNNLGHYRRAKLELLCAWKTFDKWKDCPLTDNLARDLLEMAEKCLVGKVTIEELEQKSDNFYAIVDDLISEGEEYLDVVYAGFACESAIRAVLYDIDLDIAGIPDKDKEPEEWTACANACDAYSRAKSWEIKDSNAPKRKEFWEWFLQIAIPSVWNTFAE